MRLTSARIIRTIFQNRRILRSHAALVSIAGLAGCNTCVTITSNPPTGTLGIVASDPRPVCTLPKMNAAVRPQLAAVPACNSCVGSGQVQHVFLGIRGIEINSSATAGDDSPDWQELLPPELELKPLQIDLMENNTDQAVQAPFGKTALVPAGIYRQLRLRLVTNQPAMEDRPPAQNMCGGGTFNCIIMADGSIQPLRLDEVSSVLRVTSENMEGTSLPFLPDTDTDLVIELKLVWEWSSSADKGARLLPTLASSAKVRRIKLNEMGTPEDGVGNNSGSR